MNQEIEAQLKSLCGKNSHPQYPLLRIDYSPTSRYPAVDFTSWIVQKLRERRFQDIAYLLTQLTLANPGVGATSEYWNHQALKICNLDIRTAIACDDNRAIFDLHAALFPYVLHGTLNGFMLVDSHTDYLARVMSPYELSVPKIEVKVGAANQFIKKMKKELGEHNTFWSSYPAILLSDMNALLNSKPPVPELRAILRDVSIGARQLFFGTLKNGSGRGHWDARPYGIDEEKAAIELVKRGLGKLNNDPILIMATYRKEELLSALTNYPIKKGWNKQYLIRYIIENAPKVQANLTKGKTALTLQSDSISDGSALESWVSRTKTLLSVALGFESDSASKPIKQKEGRIKQ